MGEFFDAGLKVLILDGLQNADSAVRAARMALEFDDERDELARQIENAIGLLQGTLVGLHSLDPKAVVSLGNLCFQQYRGPGDPLVGLRLEPDLVVPLPTVQSGDEIRVSYSSYSSLGTPLVEVTPRINVPAGHVEGLDLDRLVADINGADIPGISASIIPGTGSFRVAWRSESKGFLKEGCAWETDDDLVVAFAVAGRRFPVFPRPSSEETSDV